MRIIILLISSVIAFSFYSCKEATQDSKTGTEVLEAMQAPQKLAHPKDGMFIHLSSGPENPQRVLMALNMAKMMSEDKEVLLHIDITGIYTILNDSLDITFKEFPSSQSLLSELQDKGVTVVACPGCLKAADKTKDDVLDWIQIASKEKFFDFCDGKIISIDY